MVEGISDADRQQIQKLRELVKDEVEFFHILWLFR